MKIKVIKPTKFKGKALLSEFKGGAQAVAKDIKADLGKTVATWREKPTFNVTVRETTSALLLEATTDSEIYGFVDKGTKVRRALMTPNFRAKTKPAIGGGAAVRLTSGSGSGGVAYISRRVHRPGIQARGFTKAILEKQQRTLTARMTPYVSRGVRATGHGL